MAKPRLQVRGSCHCGAVEFELAERPDSLTECNCSVCRRLACLWAYGNADTIKLTCADDATLQYVWGDKSLAFHTCRTCGCTTHWESLVADQHPRRMAVNFRMADPDDIADLRIRHFDGADTWTHLD